VGDARDANSAAMMRYPLALPGLSSDLQQAATRFVADVIEEKSGHRPTTGGISPTITLDGFDVKLSLNGVPDEALGTLSASDVVGEVSARTQRYATRTATLLGDTSQTEDRLAFLERMLDAWRDGLGASAGVDISDLEVASKPAAGATPATATAASSKTSAAVRSLGGLAIRHCSGASPATIAKNETPADAQPKAKQAPKQPTAHKPAAHAPATGQGTGTKWIDLPDAGPEVMDGPAQH
jgi:hypothetical protein